MGPHGPNRTWCRLESRFADYSIERADYFPPSGHVPVGAVFALLRIQVVKKRRSHECERGTQEGVRYVENRKMVVLWNVAPGFRTTEGNFGWFGESGKCCVSRQNP